MRKSLIKIVLIVTSIVAVSCASGNMVSDTQSTIVALNNKTIIPDGALVYALPLTVVDVEIESERVIEKPGPYSKFAEDLLGLTDVIKTEKESWKLKSITISTHSEPDPDEFYVVEAGSLFYTNVLALKEAGLIMDLNPEIFDRGDNIIKSEKADPIAAGTFDLGADEYFMDQRDTVYRLVSVDTAFVKVPYLVEKKQRLNTSQLAEKAAVRLMELRDGKHLILTGEANVFPQDEAAITEMRRLEKEYTELFTGKVVKSLHASAFHLIPQPDQKVKPLTVCAFSQSLGICAANEKSAVPVNLEFIPAKVTGNIKSASDQGKSSSSSKNNKLFYRIPDIADISVSVGKEKLNTTRKLIYQFGEVLKLPENYIIGK